MTDSEKLTMLRTLCEYTEDELSDDSLNVYLAMAADIVLRKAYPFVNDLTGYTFPSKYDTIHVQIANEIIQKRGAEGETGHTESGLTRTYETAGISESLMNQIIPYAKVPGAKSNADN